MAEPQSEKLRHLAVCLPFLGLFLLMPPALLVFDADASLAGMPLIVLYLFGVWAGLIIAAAILSRYLDQRAPVLPSNDPDQDTDHHAADPPAFSRYPPS